MTKKDLMQDLREALEAQGMREIDFGSGSIGWNSTKSMIQYAIDCLKCSDGELDKMAAVFAAEYPNTWEKLKCTDWKHHFFNRAYVYSCFSVIQSLEKEA